jgi:hypothetical protein
VLQVSNILAVVGLCFWASYQLLKKDFASCQ